MAFPYDLSSMQFPMTSESMPLVRNVFIASVGVFTTGSPLTLNDVFYRTGTPVDWPNFSIS